MQVVNTNIIWVLIRPNIILSNVNYKLFYVCLGSYTRYNKGVET